MKTLYVIPARGGSKGLPGKNIRKLNGKPLIYYSIEAALQIADRADICVSTDDIAIKNVVEDIGLDIPFLRPTELSSDSASMQDVILHALDFYKTRNVQYDIVVLLQPTSPFRQANDIRLALSLYDSSDDMVMSVFETKANPYYVLFEEISGFLAKSKDGSFETRQSAPMVYQANGAIYVINVKSLMAKSMKKFARIKKYVMSEITSVDIDTSLDWDYCEFLISKRHVNT